MCYHATFVTSIYVKVPCQDRIRETVLEFETLLGFPKVIGAIDGNHILKPTECPLEYYNRTRFYSISIQGIVDLQGHFIDVKIGWPGKVNDARVLANSTFYHKANSGNLFLTGKG